MTADPRAQADDAEGQDSPSFDDAERGLVSAFIDTMASSRRSASMLAAMEAVTLTQLVAVAHARAERRRSDGRDPELPMRELACEIAAALRVSDRVSQRLISDAVTLTTAFPMTHAALSEGRITSSHVRVIVAAGTPIVDDDARCTFETTVLPIADVESAGRLAPMAERLAARLNPESIDDRHRRARRHRTVALIDDTDGMAELRAYLPATLAHGIFDRLTQLAKRVQTQESREATSAAVGDGVLLPVDGLLAEPRESEPDAATAAPRGIDELRADLFADVLLTGQPTGHGDGLHEVRGFVQVTVPAPTLVGASTEPAVLAGYGPVDADTVRCLAATAPGWDRVFTDPVTGDLRAVDRYRPSEALRRFLRVRDEHCRFPACRMPVWAGDLDHTIEAALGGATSDDNLEGLCRRHHVVRHQTDWQVRQLGRGALEWVSPTGRVYVDTPERTLVFVAEGDPPPF